MLILHNQQNMNCMLLVIIMVEWEEDIIQLMQKTIIVGTILMIRVFIKLALIV
jgi:hypothetical protein